MFNELALLDDAYLWTSIREQREKVTDDKLKLLIHELLTRNYKHSLYKSLAEYDLLFESFTISEKENIYTYLTKHIDENAPFVLDNKRSSPNYKAGFLTNEILTKLTDKNSSLSGIKNIVFASPDYSLKTVNPQKVIIRFNEEKVVVLDEITLLKERSIMNASDTKHYFYLFYEMKDGVTIENLSEELIAAIKSLLIDEEKCKVS